MKLDRNNQQIKRTRVRTNRISLQRMAKAYFHHLLEDEKRKAVNTIQKGRHVPNFRDYHRSSSRLKEKQGAEAAIQEAQLLEFQTLDAKEGLLNDVDYMRWVYLHPHFTVAQKKIMLESRREQIERRGRMDTPSKTCITQ